MIPGITLYGGKSRLKLNVNSVFNTTLYTGNGSTQTINNGINLAAEGGLVWIKGRDAAYSHYLTDTTRGASKILQSQATLGQADQSPHGLYEFLSSGFSVSATTYNGYNNNGATFASWSFRKAPKFFDVVTYTGNGVSRDIPHNLGVLPGMILIKCTSINGSGWVVWHRGAQTQYVLELQSTDQQFFDNGGLRFGTGTDHTDETFRIGSGNTGSTNQYVNVLGASFVAYLFAHDPSPDGIIQCGSYTGNGSSTGPTISLGWEPQYVLLKNSTATSDWSIFDAQRGISSGADGMLFPNKSNAETVGFNFIQASPTGFQLRAVDTSINQSGETHIYMAIRAEGV